MLWWEDIFRGLFFFIDRGIHWLIVQLYDIFLSLASFELFEPELLQEFSTRIYGFLGVFMLFRITFSLITYLVNPDQINDKNNGIGKIVINVVVVLALILMVPTIFEMAMDLQKMIIQDNTVGKLVLGITDVGEDAQQNPGGTISWTLFSAFLIDNTDVSCDNATVARSNYQKAKSKKDMNLLSQDESYNAKCKDSAGTEKYVFTYHPLVAVIASIFTAYILITYCVQVGFRTIKLGLLQLLAPIPIISIIDPKSSKNGAFSSWLKMCINTYLEIFVRLATLSFLILVLDLLTPYLDSNDQNIFVVVFLLLGALLLAQQAPKLLSELFGTKGDGGATTKSINGMLKAGLGIGAAGVATAGATALGFGVNGANAINNFKEAEGVKGKTGAIFSGIGSALAGGLSSGTRTLIGYDKKSGMGQNLMRGFQGNIAARDSRELRKEAGYSVMDNVTDNIKSKLGFKPSTGGMEKSMEQEIAQHQALAQQYQTAATTFAANNGITADQMEAIQNGSFKGTMTSVQQTYSDYLNKANAEAARAQNLSNSSKMKNAKARNESFKASRKGK